MSEEKFVYVTEDELDRLDRMGRPNWPLMLVCFLVPILAIVSQKYIMLFLTSNP